MELVDKVKNEQIFLSIGSQELVYYPVYRETEFTATDPNLLDELGYLPDQTAQWALRYGEAIAGIKSVRPVMRQRVHEGIDPGLSVIGRDTRVCNATETIGYIDHLLVDDASGEITHLIVRRGLLPFRAVIPMSMVDKVREETVYVPLSRKEIRKMAIFTPRADQDILAEVEDRLQASAEPNLSQIKVSLVDGLVRRTGHVATVVGKKRAEQIAKSVKGVLGVDNRIHTDL